MTGIIDSLEGITTDIQYLTAWKKLASRLDMGAGYVYLMHLETTPYYKIGRSKNPQQRISEVGGAVLPLNITLVHKIASGDSRASERELQRRFKSKRHRGEWYTLDASDVAYICELTDLTPADVLEARARLADFERRHNIDVRAGESKLPDSTHRERTEQAIEEMLTSLNLQSAFQPLPHRKPFFTRRT